MKKISLLVIILLAQGCSVFSYKYEVNYERFEEHAFSDSSPKIVDIKQVESDPGSFVKVGNIDIRQHIKTCRKSEFNAEYENECRSQNANVENDERYKLEILHEVDKLAPGSYLVLNKYKVNEISNSTQDFGCKKYGETVSHKETEVNTDISGKTNKITDVTTAKTCLELHTTIISKHYIVTNFDVYGKLTHKN